MFGDTTRNKNEKAIIFNKQTTTTVKCFIHISSGVALIKITAKPFHLQILQAYAATFESNEIELEEISEQLMPRLDRRRLKMW